MRSKFLEIENNIKKHLHTILNILNEQGSFNKKEARDYAFSGLKKNQLIDLMQHLERYTNTLPVFGFNSGRYDINLI